jgi:hypothetical protein
MPQFNTGALNEFLGTSKLVGGNDLQGGALRKVVSCYNFATSAAEVQNDSPKAGMFLPEHAVSPSGEIGAYAVR